MPASIKKSQQYVALLRGINVGGNCRVEMSRLKQLCVDLGLTNVSTYINSGNVLFTSALPNATIEKKLTAALSRTFAFDIPLVLRTAQDLQRICRATDPSWQNDADQKTDVLFLWDAVDSSTSIREIQSSKGVDELRYVSGAIIWHIDRKQYTKSGMHKFIGTRLYKQMTARNINTVRKLALLLGVS